uniref:Ionotropic receptor n=1 Tax=Dendrolimus houi TaxID=765132 RepID=A0A076E9D5_9NEOP|nr:ionotropic receptor [Dendrolimus houi]
MAGIDLIISTICNATFCEVIYDNPKELPQTRTQSELYYLAKEINGKHLKIATYDNYPISWVEKAENGTNVGRGTAFIIVEILQKRFNFTYELVVPERNYESGGVKSEDSLIGLLNSSKVDMVAAFLPKLTKFQKMVSFSHTLDEGVWRMMLKRPKESAAGSGLLAPFNSLVWYLILAVVFFYGPCITLLTRIRSKIIRDEEHHLPLSPSFWFVYSAFIKQGTSLEPEANSTRILFATWWIFIIFLSAFYTANLTAFLTLSKFTLEIENTIDLYKKNYRWVAQKGGSVECTVTDPSYDLYYLNKMLLNGRAEFRNVKSDIDYLPIVQGGAVLVKEQIAIDHLMYNDYLSKSRDGVEEANRCTYVVAPNPFMKQLRAFGYPYDSKLKLLFDSTLVYIQQSGIINFLINQDLPSTKICPLDLQSKDRQLRNTDLMMTYMIIVAGVCAALAVFIAELVIKRYVYLKIRKGDKSKRKKLRFNRDISQRFNDTRPPPYDSLFGNESENSIKKIINGREYYVFNKGNGVSKLVPVRAPSALLYR